MIVAHGIYSHLVVQTGQIKNNFPASLCAVFGAVLLQTGQALGDAAGKSAPIQLTPINGAGGGGGGDSINFISC